MRYFPSLGVCDLAEENLGICLEDNNKEYLSQEGIGHKSVTPPP